MSDVEWEGLGIGEGSQSLGDSWGTERGGDEASGAVLLGDSAMGVKALGEGAESLFAGGEEVSIGLEGFRIKMGMEGFWLK